MKELLESEFFERFDAEELIGVLAIVCVAVVMLVWVVVWGIVAFRRVTRETALKEMLVKSGYDADEIERIVGAVLGGAERQSHISKPASVRIADE